MLIFSPAGRNKFFELSIERGSNQGDGLFEGVAVDRIVDKRRTTMATSVWRKVKNGRRRGAGRHEDIDEMNNKDS